MQVTGGRTGEFTQLLERGPLPFGFGWGFLSSPGISHFPEHAHLRCMPIVASTEFHLKILNKEYWILKSVALKALDVGSGLRLKQEICRQIW